MSYTLLNFVNFKSIVEMYAMTGQADKNAKQLLTAEAKIREHFKLSPKDDLMAIVVKQNLPSEMDAVMDELKWYVNEVAEIAEPFDNLRAAVDHDPIAVAKILLPD